MIEYIHEPTDLQCGQAVLAMVLGKTVEEIVIFLQNDRETTLAEMKRTFREHGVHMSDERIAVQKRNSCLLCLLSLETPRCWHWSLYADGTFYDPEHGVMSDFPVQTENIIETGKAVRFIGHNPVII
ncbi:MAG: hypothetical protein ACLS48_09255 [[Eubacterium] siraeum]